MESPVFSVLIFAAFGLLLMVSSGVAYLTVVEWRDRRRREDEKRANRPTKARK